MLIKALWNNALAAKAQLSKQSSFASLLNTNIPMGNKKGQRACISVRSLLFKKQNKKTPTKKQYNIFEAFSYHFSIWALV